MSIALDHLMWGAPSLEAGVREAQRLFGVAPAPGGVHPGRGTCNALLSLGGKVYLEVIAPDPAQDLTGNLGGRLSTLERSGLITWAAASSDLGALAAAARALEITARGPFPTQREVPSGGTLHWELLFLGGHPFGNLVPFFIDWQETPHPATTNPLGGEYQAIEIRSPRADELNTLFERLDIAATAVAAAEPGLSVTVSTNRGTVRLETAIEARNWTI